MEVLRCVVEGIIYVLKMNFSEGIKVFNSLHQNQCYLRNSKIYAPTISAFKIFSYYSLHQFDAAFQEFSQLKTKRLSESNKYNYTMLKAIRAAQSK